MQVLAPASVDLPKGGVKLARCVGRAHLVGYSVELARKQLLKAGEKGA